MCTMVGLCIQRWFNVYKGGSMCTKVIKCVSKVGKCVHRWVNVYTGGLMCTKVGQCVQGQSV